MRIINPTEEQLVRILFALNEEFVLNKGYKLLVQDRFEGLFDKNNLNNIYALVHNTDILSIVAVKVVGLNIGNEICNSFFIGSVYTSPNYRGKGYSSKLLSHVCENYFAKDYQLGVLWTSLGNFYQKLNWQYSDNGLFISCTTESYLGDKSLNNNGDIYKLTTQTAARIDRYRLSKLNNYVIRNYNGSCLGYKTVYNPGEESIGCYIERNNEIKGYLLGAVKLKEVYVYEIVTDNTKNVELLFGYIIKGYQPEKIHINIFQKDNLVNIIRKLFRNADVKNQKLQMIYTADKNSKFNSLIKNSFYIPFSDRI